MPGSKATYLNGTIYLLPVKEILVIDVDNVINWCHYKQFQYMTICETFKDECGVTVVQLLDQSSVSNDYQEQICRII